MNIKNIKISTILLGIILIIAGCFMISKPTDSFIVMSSVLGIGAAVKGIMLIVMYFRARDRYLVRANAALAAGIALVLFGLVFIFKPIVFAAIITYIVALWFILTAVAGLNVAQLYKDNRPYYYLNMILNIMLLIGAGMILFNAMSVAVSMSIILGMLLIIDGVASIAWALSIRIID